MTNSPKFRREFNALLSKGHSVKNAMALLSQSEHPDQKRVDKYVSLNKNKATYNYPDVKARY